MTPYKQKFHHDPENGVYGDCFRTTIACMLDLKPERVPHFLADGDMEQGMPRAQEFLKDFGLTLIEIPLAGDLDVALFATKNWSNKAHTFLVGTSATGCNHVVVCKDGAIVHDPSLTDAGIVGPASDGYYWIGFLARLI